MKPLVRNILIASGIVAGGITLIVISNRSKRMAANGTALFIGDSYTAGPNSYADYLKAQFPKLQIKKIAKVGETTDWMLSNSANEINNGKYDVVFILGGINDIYAKGGIGQTKQNLNEMYSLAKAAGSKVIAVTISPSDYYPPYTPSKGNLTNELNDWIKKNRMVDEAIDFNRMLTKDGKQNLDLFLSDRLHATAGAHQMLADYISKKVYA